MQAFVALGGEPGGGGGIDKLKLKQVVENEFGLQIDIEASHLHNHIQKLIEVIDQDDNKIISYEEFKSLLSSH